MSCLRRLLAQLNGDARDRDASVPDEGHPGREIVIAVALISGVAALAGRAALLPIINVGAVCLGFVYLCVSIAAWKASARATDRKLAVVSAIVSAFMSAYVINGAVRAEGWDAPEVLVAFSWLFLGAALWKVFHSKRRVDAP
jgi:basic amino acid/polyamine antiporter, APA family